VGERVSLRVNGVERTIEADPATPLLAVLRGELGLTGPRFGCGANQCGACFVLIGDRAVASCDTPLWAAAGKDIATVEGLGTPEHPHPLQSASSPNRRCNAAIASPASSSPPPRS
jgi:nicotinate dehydrogenase subunit A